MEEAPSKKIRIKKVCKKEKQTEMTKKALEITKKENKKDLQKKEYEHKHILFKMDEKHKINALKSSKGEE